MTEGNQDVEAKPGGFTRRSMIAGSASVATTMAVTAVAPVAAGAMSRPEPAPTQIAKPSTPMPQDTVVAYVHDVARSEVTIIHGEAERTYRDPSLVKRLLAAAHSSSKEGR